MDEEQLLALRRLTHHLGCRVLDGDFSTREGCWTAYLMLLYLDRKYLDKEPHAREQRRESVLRLDACYGRRVECDDFVQIAHACSFDLFDVVLWMPTIVEDLLELRIASEGQ